MHIKSGFTLRNICGENIIVCEGIENIDFTQIISLNESAAVVWRAAEGGEFTADALVSALTAEYEIDGDTARHDVDALLRQWQQLGLTE